MWVKSYVYDNKARALRILVSESPQDELSRGEVMVSYGDIEVLTTDLKLRVKRNEVDGFTLSTSKGYCQLILITKADENWNSLIAKKHPIRWKLGLVARSKRRRIIVCTSSCIGQLQDINLILHDLGYRVEES